LVEIKYQLYRVERLLTFYFFISLPVDTGKGAGLYENTAGTKTLLNNGTAIK
jgi:hypothetical protein